MKMTLSHYARLESGINDLLSRYPSSVADYEAGKFPRAEKVKDLQTRFCFDLFSAVCRKDTSLTSDLYQYLNDDHIGTALKKICPRVQRKF